MTEHGWDRGFWFLCESRPNEGKALEQPQVITDHRGPGDAPHQPKTQGKLPFTFPARGLKAPGPWE